MEGVPAARSWQAQHCSNAAPGVSLGECIDDAGIVIAAKAVAESRLGLDPSSSDGLRGTSEEANPIWANGQDRQPLSSLAALAATLLGKGLLHFLGHIRRELLGTELVGADHGGVDRAPAQLLDR